MKIKTITDYLESVAPPALQESYDNAGLIIGDESSEITSAIVTIDVTEDVVDEAVKKNAGLIISHHPLIFSGLKKVTGKNYTGRAVIKAIKNNVAVFAAHTNLDAVQGGVNSKICSLLGLKNCRILRPEKAKLKKLVTFIPREAADRVRAAIFETGAGNIGNYDYCGYSTEGKGTFRGNEKSDPYTGRRGEIHTEEEIRFETIFPEWLQSKIIAALLSSHPYEEVAYDVYPLDNTFPMAGMGMTGTLSEPLPEQDFLKLIKKTFNTGCIKHTKLTGNKVRQVAVSGGSGSELLREAISANADAFVTADFKYHQFFDAENKILIADIGHFESEQFTKDLFRELLIKKFPKFAVHFSEVRTNPVYYF
ncbi:MAG: Nif3-like dinuclear metal center hexameric protein [Prolixibacteraceae bacterium]|nr:Nif3-like dinuclear metal center hexameric protein [Prolixibacteraceae bacterium]